MITSKLHLALLLAIAVALASSARADDAPGPAEQKPGAPSATPISPPQPDMNKPITITLGQLQILIEAATAKGVAEAKEQPAQVILQDLIRQATPKANTSK